MGYHLVDPDDLDQHDDRPADVRSLTAAAGMDGDEEKLGARVYTVDPGQAIPLAYHYHDDQVELFYVLSGTLCVETPDREYAVDADQALLVEPDSPQRAYNPDDADAPVRTLAVGAPSVDDVHAYDPE